MKKSIHGNAGTKIVLASTMLSLACLVILHFVSAEFEPGWRMVSEYALGNYKVFITLFFVLWGIGSISLAIDLWKQVSNTVEKTGIVLLFVSGIGEILAAAFDVTEPVGHGIAGMLGVPVLPVAALMITYSLVRRSPWSAHRKILIWSAHFTLISLLGMGVAMMVMMSQFAGKGIEIGADAAPPVSLPDGVIAFGGYLNRLLILSYQFWLILMVYSGHPVIVNQQYNSEIGKDFIPQ